MKNITRNHNLCFEQKYEKYKNFLYENFHILVVKFSGYLNKDVFVMILDACQYSNSGLVQILG